MTYIQAKSLIPARAVLLALAIGAIAVGGCTSNKAAEIRSINNLEKAVIAEEKRLAEEEAAAEAAEEAAAEVEEAAAEGEEAAEEAEAGSDGEGS